MADPALLAEAYKRDLLPPNKAAAYEEAVRRGLVSAPPPVKARADAEQRIKSAPDQVRAISKGASLGFADELDAASAALETGAHNLFNRVNGKPSVGYGMKDAYGAVMDANREHDNLFAQEHPVQNVGLQLAGGLSAPGVAAGARYIRGATSLGGAAARSAVVGGAVGAVTGAGNSEGVRGRAVGAAEGLLAGGAVGVAAPYAARAGQAVAKRAGAGAVEAGTRVGQAVGLTPRAPTAAQRARAVDKATSYVADLAQKAPPGALSGNPFEAQGKPVTAAEAIGRPGVTQLAAIGRRSGQTPDALESTLRQRAQAMPERVLTDLQDVTGLAPEAIHGDFATHAKALRAAASPVYDEAYSVGGVTSQKLQTLLARPSMRKAMSRAAGIAAEEGRDPAEIGFTIGKVGTTPRTAQLTHQERIPGGGTRDVVQEVAATPSDRLGMIRMDNPTAQSWDYVKRGLDDVLETYRDKTTGRLRLDEKGRATLGTLNALRDELVALNPKYGQALAAGGEPLKLEQAFRNAPRLMSDATPRRLFDQHFDAMTPAEQQAHVGGFVNDAFERARSGRLRLKDMQSPNFAGKIAKMIGPERAQALLTKLQAEADLARTGGRMMPGAGSPTMELQAADAERAQTLQDMRGAARTLASGKPISAAFQAIASPVAGAYRGMQAPIDEATRDEVGRLLQLSPSELDRALKAAGARAPRSYKRVGRAVPAAANIFATGTAQK